MIVRSSPAGSITTLTYCYLINGEELISQSVDVLKCVLLDNRVELHKLPLYLSADFFLVYLQQMLHKVLQVIFRVVRSAELHTDDRQQLQKFLKNHASLLPLPMINRNNLLPSIAIPIHLPPCILINILNQLHKCLLGNLPIRIPRCLCSIHNEQKMQFL